MKIQLILLILLLFSTAHCFAITIGAVVTITTSIIVSWLLSIIFALWILSCPFGASGCCCC